MQEYSIATPSTCEDSFLDIYDGSTAMSAKQRHFCGSYASDIKSTTSKIFLRMFAEDFESKPHFKAILTAFTNGKLSKNIFQR